MKLTIYYDEFGDYIELYTGNHRQHRFMNLGKGIFELKGNKTKKTEGFAIHAFRKQTQNMLKIKGICFHYDEAGDLLELGIGKPTSSYLNKVGEGVFQRMDEKTGKTTGLAIQGLKIRTKKTLETEISLPQKIELSH